MQQGTIRLRGTTWLLMYKEPVLVDGVVVMRRKAKKLATRGGEDGRKFLTESSVRKLATKILAPINAQTHRPESTTTVAGFIEHNYIPDANRELKPSSQAHLRVMFQLVKPYLNGLELREVRTSDVERILRDIADSKPRASSSLKNARNFLSGAFRYAIRKDLLDRENPVREAKTPKGLKPSPKNTHAYTLEEIQKIVDAVQEPARTIFLTAALSGLRPGEIRGLRWEDYDGEEFQVRRSVWNKHVTGTKTDDVSPVPVIKLLRVALDAHKKRSPGSQYIFEGSTGNPLILVNFIRREVKPALAEAKLEWFGLYGFRRGLASNLYRLGVPDAVIQRILRHADVETTQRHYIKTSDPDAVAAMRKLERAFKKSR
jgi:integrase